MVSFFASSSAFSLPLTPTCAGIHFTIIFFPIVAAFRNIFVAILFDLSPSSALRSILHAVSESVGMSFPSAFCPVKCCIAIWIAVSFTAEMGISSVIISSLYVSRLPKSNSSSSIFSIRLTSLVFFHLRIVAEPNNFFQLFALRVIVEDAL
jgi:hypothetical protein